MRIYTQTTILLFAILAFALASSLYRVSETEVAVKLRFGAMVQDGIQPGLHIRMPFVEQVRIFDARVLTVDAPAESFYTVQKKRLIVDSFVKWRVIDVGEYYRATGGDPLVARNRLSARVNDGLRNEFGTRTLHEVVSGQRDELMDGLTRRLNLEVQDALGIKILDVRIKRIDLPDEVSDDVYKRMQAERQKEALEYRSEGREAAEKIRADADRQKILIEAEAYSRAEIIRGEGDAEAAAIYAAAYNQSEKSREFYAFTRSLNAYRATFGKGGDLLLISPDSDFFRYLNNQNQRTPQ